MLINYTVPIYLFICPKWKETYENLFKTADISSPHLSHNIFAALRLQYTRDMLKLIRDETLFVTPGSNNASFVLQQDKTHNVRGRVQALFFWDMYISSSLTRPQDSTFSYITPL